MSLKPPSSRCDREWSRRPPDDFPRFDASNASDANSSVSAVGLGVRLAALAERIELLGPINAEALYGPQPPGR